MKPQDLIFIVTLIILLFIRRSKLFAVAGMVCLLAAIPLFGFWVFFTAQRLVYYAGAFFFVACLINLFKNKK